MSAISEQPLRVAIVGQGPKGTFALERLLDHGAALGVGERVSVELFEPHPVPGAGPVYDPAQPEYLRMNFPASRIDMWASTSRTVSASQRLSFTAWAQQTGDRVEDESYPPRALVGRYLCEGHEIIRSHAPAQIEIRLMRTRVDEIRRNDASWTVSANGESRDYEEILVATGHETGSAESLAASWNHAVLLVPSVFPVQSRLSHEAIAPGSTVAVRGFGLSFIDAALALTEGRGGRFEQTEHPYRLRYLAGQDEVARILPFSRTGRPMLPKPGAAIGISEAEKERIAAVGTARITSLPADSGVMDELLGVILDTAIQMLMLTGAGDGHYEASRRARDLIDGASRGVVQARESFHPTEEIERGLAVGAGMLAPDVEWAVGESWRALYPALVERLGGHGLQEHDWPSFRRLATHMERLAFGPAPINAAKLLALIAAGRVELRHVLGGRLVSTDSRTWLTSGSGSDPCEVDAVVDAVLPSPGAEGKDEGLLGQLVKDGHARVAPARRGLEVGSDGSCVGSDGEPSWGLSAIGRPTEDSVIGNDTLDRSLHQLADHWAERVIERCRSPGSAAEAEIAMSGVGG